MSASQSSGTARLAADFVAGILKHFGLRVRLAASERGEGDVVVQIEGDIQRLTADHDLTAAIAQLAGQAVSHAIEGRARVSIEVGGVGIGAPAPAGRTDGAPTGHRPPPGPPPDRSREQFLLDMAAELADVVARTGRRAVLEGLASPERRIVHTALMDRRDVNTHSEGGESNRYLLVEPGR